MSWTLFVGAAGMASTGQATALIAAADIQRLHPTRCITAWLGSV